IGIAGMFRGGSEFGLKARARKTAWSRLPNTPLPAIAALKDGGFMFLGKSRRGQGARAVAVIAAASTDDPGRVRGGLGRASRADDAAGRIARSLPPFRYHVVPRCNS